MSEQYRDTERRCPVCQSNVMFYTVIPEHRREWVADDGKHVDFWPVSRDYKCRDCDTEFVMTEEMARGE